MHCGTCDTIASDWVDGVLQAADLKSTKAPICIRIHIAVCIQQLGVASVVFTVV
jgi:hypothetical protein